ncbi:MAG TPA: extracellular solute-binding protein [Candidatus Magasanikbacteria bacterium]|jgi:multiple sugar transport system substrate-binding protein|nr:extracellular solute-binding protein [Candidatus Magasanikbacteria bacterium]HQL53022.1 extracellular solute-binding protein [Candidatus Magasanikbacteria bacterium]
MKIFYKKFTIIFLLIFLVFAGFGCRGLSSKEKAVVKRVTLNYWTVYDDVEQLRKFATDYKMIRSHVTVNIKQVREDQFEQLFINALADDVAPDIVSIHVRDMNKYLTKLSPMPKGFTVPSLITTGKYFKETKIIQNSFALPTADFVKNNFVQTVYDDVVREGKIYGIPLAMDTLAVYYNQDLLDQAGVATAPTTWDEFMEAVKKSTKFDKDGNITQAGVALGTSQNIKRSFDILSVLMMQSGVTMAQDKYVTFANGVKKFDTTYPVFKVLQFYTDFANKNKEVYTWNNTLEDSLNYFTKGKSVFYFGFAYDYNTIRARAPQMNLKVISLPQLNPESPINIANYWLQAVVKKSKHQNEAWDFINFIIAQDRIKEYTKKTGYPTPLRIQIAEQKEDPILAPFVEYVLQAKNWYYGSDKNIAEEAINNLISNYLLPTPEGLKENEWKINILNSAARQVQQSM